MPTLAIVIPAFNEEAVLGDTLTACQRAFEGDERLQEIIVIDDGSRDGTAHVAEQFSAEDDRIRVLRNAHCVGCVPSVLRGFAEATTDFAFFLPADGQIDAEVARVCLDAAGQGHDVVLTRRSNRQDPWFRVWMSRTYNRLMRLAVPGFPASDIDSSCLFRTELARREVHEPGAFALVELVLAALRDGASILELPIQHHPRQGGRPHGLRPREVLAAARGLWRIIRIRKRVHEAAPP